MKRQLGSVLLCVPLLLSAVTTSALAKDRIAVLNFKNLSDLSPQSVDYLTDDVVRGEIRRILPRDQFFVVTKESLESFLSDQGVNLEDVCEGSCEVDIGRKIQVHLIITGTVRKIQGEIVVTLKNYNTKTGEFIGSEQARGKDLASTEANLRKAVGRLLAITSKSASGVVAPMFDTPDTIPVGPKEAVVTEVKPTTVQARAKGPAGLYITTDPPDADVYLGSIKMGTTDPAFQKTDLKAGTKVRVTLKKREYHDKIFDIDLKPGITRYEGVKLAPAFGTVAVKSTPEGARIIIGGKEVGLTPYRNERVPSGQLLVSLEKELYVPVRNQVLLIEDGQVLEKSYSLEPNFGTLAVNSMPSGATVLIDGRDRGKTPARINLSPGDYDVLLELPGYTGREFHVALARGKESKITEDQAELIKRVFKVHVFADPPDQMAMIYLDGKETGKFAPDTLSGLEEGRHIVQLKTEDKAGKSEILGTDGETKSVTIALEVKKFASVPYRSQSKAAGASGMPSARDITLKARDKQFPENSVSDLTMILINKRGNKRERKISTKRKNYGGGEAKSVAYFLSPSDVKGTAFLVWEHEGSSNDVFIYLPALKKVRRIASEQKHQSFMGSDFSYADMENEDIDDSTHKTLREEELEGTRCWVIESTPKPESDSEYGKVVSWVTQDNYIPAKVEFYDKKERLLKVMSVEKIGPVGTEILPLHFVMEDVQKKHKTEIILDEIELDVSIPDGEFTHRAIQR